MTLPSSNEPLANKDPPANEDSIADESSTNNAKDLPSNEGSTANRGPTSNEEPSESKEPTTENASCGIQQFPVIVFSHGLSAHFTCSNAICYDLASHGYVVASVEHKDGSSCIALKRVPGRGVQEGDYDRYIDEWIPFNKIQNIPMTRGQDIRENESTYSDRNSQVITLLFIYVCHTVKPAYKGHIYDQLNWLLYRDDLLLSMGNNMIGTL